MSQPQQPVVLLRRFVTFEEQQELLQEVLQAHRSNSAAPLSHQESVTSSQSIRLDLGIPCGGDLSLSTPTAVRVGRRAFRDSIAQRAVVNGEGEDGGEPGSVVPKALRILGCCDTPLTGTALLYGPRASMSPHYDSPTQPLQREEWLCVLSVGLTALFRCDGDRVELHSGDALVMDSMAVLHGVEEILEAKDDGVWKGVGLPWPTRLGVIVWHGRSPNSDTEREVGDNAAFEGMAAMFDGGDSEQE